MPCWRCSASAAMASEGILPSCQLMMSRYFAPCLAVEEQVSIGEISFNPYTLEAQVHDFKLAEADGAPLVGFRHLLVNATLASIWQRAVSLQEVRIDAPAIDLVIAKDGSVNLAALAPAPTQPPPTQPSERMRMRLGKFSVSDGRVSLRDNTRSKPFTAAIAPVRFILTDFRTDAGYQNAYQFAGTTQAGEQLSWAGEFTVQPLGSNGKFSVIGLKAGTIDSYIYDAVPFKLASGTLTLGGDYRFTLDPFGLDVSLPSIAVRDLRLAERKNDAGTPIAILLPPLAGAGNDISAPRSTSRARSSPMRTTAQRCSR